jgi:hypothetical protein
MNDDQPSFPVLDFEVDLKEAQLAHKNALTQERILKNTAYSHANHACMQIGEAEAKIAQARRDLDKLLREPDPVYNKALSALAEAQRRESELRTTLQREVDVSYEALNQSRRALEVAKRNVDILDYTKEQANYLPFLLWR